MYSTMRVLLRNLIITLDGLHKKKSANAHKTMGKMNKTRSTRSALLQYVAASSMYGDMRGRPSFSRIYMSSSGPNHLVTHVCAFT